MKCPKCPQLECPQLSTSLGEGAARYISPVMPLVRHAIVPLQEHHHLQVSTTLQRVATVFAKVLQVRHELRNEGRVPLLARSGVRVRAGERPHRLQRPPLGPNGWKGTPLKAHFSRCKLPGQLRACSDLTFPIVASVFKQLFQGTEHINGL